MGKVLCHCRLQEGTGRGGGEVLALNVFLHFHNDSYRGVRTGQLQRKPVVCVQLRRRQTKNHFSSLSFMFVWFWTDIKPMKYRTSVSWTQNHHPWTNNRIPITSYSPISYHLHIKKKNSLDLHVWHRKVHDWGYLENRVTDCSVFLCATKHSSLPPPPGGHLFNTGLRGQVLDHITLCRMRYIEAV